ncbi:MAG: hypothetical protein ACLTS2_12705 [Eggerthella lenta]
MYNAHMVDTGIKGTCWNIAPSRCGVSTSCCSLACAGSTDPGDIDLAVFGGDQVRSPSM